MTTPGNPHHQKPGRTILWAGALVGTFDIAAACIYVYFNSGGTPAAVFRYIASAILGPDAFTGGIGVVVLGLLLHYLIAYIWTAFFFIVYPMWRFLWKNWLLTGILYGLFIWTVMNRVVVPMSNTPKGPFNLTGAIINALILILAIGIPLALIAQRKFRKLY
jgi:hypothetical protein